MENQMKTASLNQANDDAQRKFMTGVYSWMVLALAISGGAAFFTANSTMMLNFIYGTRFGILVLIVGQLALVFTLAGRIRKMSVTTAGILFIAYSILTGITFSSILLVYTGSSITRIFLITALMFGGMSLYGMKTKTDLRSAGRYLMMALIGIIIASVINMIFRSSGLDWIISIITVVVFTGLTAYDTQKLLKISVNADGSENFQKIAIIGALELYLDFINIFLALLRLFGNRN